MRRNYRRFIGYTCTAIVAAHLLSVACYTTYVVVDTYQQNVDASPQGQAGYMDRLVPVRVVPRSALDMPKPARDASEG